jgi:hypothetical protein
MFLSPLLTRVIVAAGLAIALVIAGMVIGVRYEKGRRAAADAVHRAAAEMAYRRAEKASYDVGRVLTVARDRIRTQTVEIVKEIEREIPASACVLPPAARRLHDRAATGASPSGGDDAAPVTAQDFASTVAENYSIARENAERLKACQRYVRDVVGHE